MYSLRASESEGFLGRGSRESESHEILIESRGRMCHLTASRGFGVGVGFFLYQESGVG